MADRVIWSLNCAIESNHSITRLLDHPIHARGRPRRGRPRGGGLHERSPPPYQLAFTLSGQTPRVLHAQQEITVPLSITNSGVRAWDPARVHLSYHWLWIVPPELARRSRTVPYHDGIRTELREPVAPAGRMAVQGRLLAPSWPGLYWLQWDMVAEGVTWFAQVSPRQPRQLVVVLPTLNGLATPLPLMTALVGIWAVAAVRRGRARLTGRPQAVRARSLLASPRPRTRSGARRRCSRSR